MPKGAFWLLVGVLLLFPPVPSSAAGQSGVVLTGAPSGTTGETNPEVHVTAPNAVSYKYSINGAPYSNELPVQTPIKLNAGIRFGDRTFAAGTTGLFDFIDQRNTNEFFPFLGSVSLENVESQLQITYVLNRLRAAVEPENVLNLRGVGVEALDVSLKENVAATNYELRSFSMTCGELAKLTSGDSTRRFRLSLAPGCDSTTLTPWTTNGQTTISVNGQPWTSGQPFALSFTVSGSSISIEAAGPDGTHSSYSIEIVYDTSLGQSVYRSYYLRAFDPSSAYVSIHNGGAGVVSYGITFNRKFGLTTQGIIREIDAMEPEFPGESTPRKAWRFMRDNRYFSDPLTSARWYHSPALFLNSAGFGYCDDVATALTHLLTAMGYTARVWGLNGHVVAEVLVGNRWEMWDADLEVYYRNRDGLIAGVEELAADPDLITHPVDPLPSTFGAYEQWVADVYSSTADNAVSTWYSDPASIIDSSVTLQIPPGAAFEFPAVYETPLRAHGLNNAPSYTNARLVVPAGFSGTVSIPLIIHSIGWSSQPALSVITKDGAGNWDAQPTTASWIVDYAPPVTIASQPAGYYNPDQLVTLAANEPATIYYTTDGTIPTEASAVYNTPVGISAGGFVRFFAIDSVGNREQIRAYGPPVALVELRIATTTSTTITFSASASGGIGTYEYMYLLCDAQHIWGSVVQPFGSANTWTWDKAGAPAGSYTVLVFARNAGTTVSYDASAGFSLVIDPADVAPVLTNPGNQVNSDSSGSYTEVVVSDAPVGYWRLDEAAGSIVADSAGTNAGTLFGGVTQGQTGALGDGNSAMLFDGSTGYVRVVSPAVSLAGDLTIELWINVSLATRQTLISKDYLHEFELTLETSGQLNFYQGDGSTYQGFLSAVAVTANAWQHVVVTRTAGTKTIRFYVNGVPKGSGTYSTTPGAGTTAISIGRSDGGTQYVNGRLDEVAVYPVALSAARIATHYALRNPGGPGTPVALQLEAGDADGNTLIYTAIGLPPPLTVNPATGLISGTLSQGSAGTYLVTATAFDGNLSDTQAFTWTVTHVNRAPTLANPGDQTSTTNTSVSLPLAASDPDGESLTYGASGLPASVTLDPATGLLSGTLLSASVGTHLVTVTASDGSVSVSQTFTWTVVRSNVVPVLANPGNQVNSDIWGYAQAVLADGPVAYWRLGETAGTTAADSAGGHTATVFGGVAPGQSGVLADGNPAMLFNGSTGYVRAANSAALQLAGDLTIELWVNPSLTTRQTLISKDYLHEFELTMETSGKLSFYQGNGTTYAGTPSAVGAVTANTWQHVVVTRAAATRTIRFFVNGVAKGGGSYVTVPVSSTEAISIGRSEGGVQYVNGRLDEVALYPAALSAAQIAAHYAMQASVGTPAFVALPLVASDPDGDALTYSAVGLPSVLNLNPATGLISGTLSPASAGTYQVTATASDGSLSASQTFTWTITHVNRMPGLASPGDQTTSDTLGYAQAVLSDGPVAYWRLGETTGAGAADSAGSDAGAVFGGVTLGEPGALVDGNPAMLFNGSTGYVRIANSAALQLAGDLTIELWVNVSLAKRQTLISKDYLHEFELTLETSGKLSFYQGNGATYAGTPSAVGAVTANTWQHVVVTRVAATRTIRFFVNGIAKGGGSYVTAPTSSTEAISIGRSEGGVQYVNGRLDEVALYSTALTPTEVAAHYALGTSAGPPTVVSLQLVASDPDGDALAYSAIGLPPGLTVDAATGLISGTLSPTSAGTYQVTITVSDSQLSQSQTFTWTVTQGNLVASSSSLFRKFVLACDVDAARVNRADVKVGTHGSD